MAIFACLCFQGRWLEGLSDVVYENGDSSEIRLYPQEGSTFLLTARFPNSRGNVKYCTVEEVVLKKDLHFAVPSDTSEPDVTR